MKRPLSSVLMLSPLFCSLLACQPAEPTVDQLVAEAQDSLQTEITETQTDFDQDGLTASVRATLVPALAAQVKVGTTTNEIGLIDTRISSPGDSLQTTLDAILSASVVGAADRATVDVRDHALAIAQTTQPDARANRVKVKFYWDRLGNSVDHVRCLWGLGGNVDLTRASAGCELASDLNTLYAGYAATSKISDQFADGAKREGAALAALGAKIDAFESAAADASASGTVPQAITDLKTVIGNVLTDQKAREAFISTAQSSARQQIGQSLTDLSAMSAALVALTAGGPGADPAPTIHIYQHNQTDLDFLKEGIDASMGHIGTAGSMSVANRQALADAISAATTAAASNGAGPGTSFGQATAALTDAAAVFSSAEGSIADAAAGLSLDIQAITNVQKSKHDAAMAAIQNTR